ncbi:hypothetical protein [Streptomyces sasae]|uniref:hypothetical protein n=1 Tax=Streptomyces sasae TaxID=1266772 RepID=UPI00292D6C4C|nr:hypothetical protein [Streptomyces sasae]
MNQVTGSERGRTVLPPDTAETGQEDTGRSGSGAGPGTRRAHIRRVMGRAHIREGIRRATRP